MLDLQGGGDVGGRSSGVNVCVSRVARATLFRLVDKTSSSKAANPIIQRKEKGRRGRCPTDS